LAAIGTSVLVNDQEWFCADALEGRYLADERVAIKARDYES
jgi:hypothetical protein